MRKGLKAQAAVEFILTFTVFLTVVSSLAFFGYAAFERAQLNHSLGTLATELPANWSQMPAKELARQLVIEGSDLDPEAITVESASVTVDEDVDLTDRDPIAESLGGQVSRTERHRVRVSAVVSYDYEDAFLLGGGATTRATASRSYIAYTDYRTS